MLAIPLQDHTDITSRRTWYKGLCSILFMVTVQTSSVILDLLLIQQNKFCWIINRSCVAELVCTVTGCLTVRCWKIDMVIAVQSENQLGLKVLVLLTRETW